MGGASQALLGQGGGDLVGQRGQLRRVGHVDAAGGRHGAELVGGVFQRDDLGAVVGAGLGRLAEAQFVALNLPAGPQVTGLDYSAPSWWGVCVCTEKRFKNQFSFFIKKTAALNETSKMMK